MISHRRLKAYLAVTLAVVVALLGAAASSAVALPLYLGSIGNFQVSASRITGEGFDLALAVDPNSGPDGGRLPAGEVSLDSATLENLVLEKEFDLSRVLGPAGGGTWKLAITTSGRTTLTGLRLDAAGICADVVDFGPGFAVDGKGAGTDTVDDDFSLGSSTVELGRPGIEATYLSTRQIRLDGLRIDVKRAPYTLAPCAAKKR